MDGQEPISEAARRAAEYRKLCAEADKAEADAEKARAEAAKAQAEREKIGADRHWLNRHLAAVLTLLGTIATVSVGIATWVANVEKQRTDASREALKLLVEHAEKLQSGQRQERIAFAGTLAAVLPYDQAAPLLDGALAMWGTEAETFRSISDIRARIETRRPVGFVLQVAQFLGVETGMRLVPEDQRGPAPAGAPAPPGAGPSPSPAPAPASPAAGPAPGCPETTGAAVAAATVGGHFLLFAHIAEADDRAAARDLLAGLDLKGYPTAGIEYVASWQGRQGEVRYYRTEDCRFAAWLARDLTRRLNGPAFAIQDLSMAYRGLPAGRMEIWFPRLP